MSDTQIIEEGLGYGLDIEPERCDITLVRDLVETLRACPPSQRAEAVSLANDGYPIMHEFPR